MKSKLAHTRLLILVCKHLIPFQVIITETYAALLWIEPSIDRFFLGCKLYLIVLTKFIRVFVLIEFLNLTLNFLFKTRVLIIRVEKGSGWYGPLIEGSGRYDSLVYLSSLDFRFLFLFIDPSSLIQERIEVFNVTRNLSNLSSSLIGWSLNSSLVTPYSFTR